VSASPARPWVRAAVAVGITYALVGIVFAAPSAHGRAWRLAAWVVSAMVYAGHIGYERLRRGNASVAAALHVALAVALGAFGLAVAANFHSLSAGSSGQHRQLLRMSLGVWPVITALPAFLVALGVSTVLGHASRRAEGHETIDHARSN